MRPQDKKALREIKKLAEELQSQLDQLQESHQEWMDERDEETDGRFSESATGEKASDDQYNFEDWLDTVETLVSDIEDNL